MTLNGFLIVGILFLIVLCCYVIWERTNIFLNKKSRYNILNTKKNIGIWYRGIYLILFTILLSFAVKTVNNYVYSDKYFRNVDYHVLSHKGYEVGKDFYLANGITSVGEGKPNDALWDDRDGKVLLQSSDSSLKIREYTYPIYVREEIRNPWWAMWNDSITLTYKLVNLVINEDISNGFVLRNGNDSIYKLEIISDDEETFYISSVYDDNTCIKDTSTFKRTIKTGYPLLDIIAKSPKIDITSELEEYLKGTYLVRKEIPMKGNITDFDYDDPSQLCLMPGINFYNSDNLTVNNQSYSANFRKEFNIKLRDYSDRESYTFFSGIGLKKTEEFRLSFKYGSRMRLEFLKPDMKHIGDSLQRVFINSSIEDVSKEKLGSGYLYNKFVRDDNLNHIKAHLQYVIGDARTELPIKVLDFNDITEGLSQEYNTDTEFLLQSRDIKNNSNATSWIFEIKDLRSTNDLQSNEIIIFLFFILFCVTVRVLSDSFLERYTLSVTELSVYVILFSLYLVRLILAWRASTFIPVEEISLPMYLKMRTSILDTWMWVFASLPLIVSVSVEIWKRSINFKLKFPFNIQKYIDYLERPLVCLILFFVFLIIFFVLSFIVPGLERFCNITFPIISYFVYEIWVGYKVKNRGNDNLICRLIAFALLFAYLAVADAGFVIILFVYMVLHHLVLESLFYDVKNKRNKKYPILFSIISAIIVFFILLYEGDIMLFLFNNLKICIFSIAILIIILSSVFIIYNWSVEREWLTTIRKKCNITKELNKVICALVVLIIVLPSLAIFYFNDDIVSIVEDKVQHTKFRAEIQRLNGDEKIDDLIKEYEYESDDILFLMRAAHNQWFINQYIRAGEKLQDNDKEFQLQPHSNQGATFTTQTTDLVVTRYLLSEHGESVIESMLFMWLILIIIFVFEFKISEKANRTFLGIPILIYIISLMVYLSATNKIVFVGQDFPFISIQSKMAYIFPICLIIILLCRCIYVRSKDKDIEKPLRSENLTKAWWFITGMIIFTILSINTIEQKGKDQQESQFNVSRLISELSLKVDDINEGFIAFQQSNLSTIQNKKISEVWDDFIENSKYNKEYLDYLNQQISPETNKQDFFSSLLRYFNEKQLSKTDINQLLHLRRRGKICRLSLNKQHFFIPAIMEEEKRWTGNLYASKVDSKVSLFDESNRLINIETDSRLHDKLPNIKFVTLDEKWTTDSTTLFLISAEQGTSTISNYEILSDSLFIKGVTNGYRPTTSVQPGDILSLYKGKSDGDTTTILRCTMNENQTPYIVRNMWINGHKRLFYPLGKESMWTYHLGNLVSDVFSSDKSLKDTSLYLSLDYNLYKDYYDIIEEQVNANKILQEFAIKTEDQQCNSRNNIYYDKKLNKIIVKPNASISEKNVARTLNKSLKQYKNKTNPLSSALRDALQGPFDFTAVTIDGDGHIKTLFDYSRNRNLDPNNIKNINRVIGEMYQDGTNSDERDVFGSKALHHIPIGPASSFKPIAYTAVTSQAKLNWESINIENIGFNAAQFDATKHVYRYYGGRDVTIYSKLNIEGEPRMHNKYLVKSDNLYHSIIILLGMQRAGEVTDIMRPYSSNIEDKHAFPVFTYENRKYCFNPEKWWRNNRFNINDNDLLTNGLYYNFGISKDAPRFNNSIYSTLGRDSILNKIYSKAGFSRSWVFPETSSLNNADRRQNPMKEGFNQILLGAYPLQQTPLQMAVNASRLVSLNRTSDLVTILDDEKDVNYEFFDLGKEWTQSTYLKFMQRQVWSQLRAVPTKEGTASALSDLTGRMESGYYGKPYYLYCKTGTLNDDRSGKKEGDRVKHLLVIITDKPIENVMDINELRKVRYYVMYMSYIGVNKDDFSNAKYIPFIDKTLKSVSFNEYMSKN